MGSPGAEKRSPPGSPRKVRWPRKQGVSNRITVMDLGRMSRGWDWGLTSCVHAGETGDEVALHALLEGPNGFVVRDQVEAVAVPEVRGRQEGRDVAAEAARVVAEACGSGMDLGDVKQNEDRAEILTDDMVRERVLRVEGQGSITHNGDVLEWPVPDAAAALAGRDGRKGRDRLGPGMRLKVAVTGHAAVAAVKVRRAELVEGRLAPVPVRLISRVAALIAQSLLVGPGIVAVPGEEICLAVAVSSLALGGHVGSHRVVNGWGLLNVHAAKVVEP